MKENDLLHDEVGNTLEDEKKNNPSFGTVYSGCSLMESLPHESRERVKKQSEVLIKEFDSIDEISKRINTLGELSDYILEVIDDNDSGMINKDLRVIIRSLDRIRGYK